VAQVNRANDFSSQAGDYTSIYANHT